VTEEAANGASELRSFKGKLERAWLFSPERLWLLSIALHRRERWLAAFAVKQLNTILYHNSLAPEASVGTDLKLGHLSHGIVVNGNVEIGDRVKIWHNVTLTAGRPPRRAGDRAAGVPARIVIEQGVKIGANAVVIAPRGETLRIGRGARIGAGAIVTSDIPARATVVSPPSRILLRDGSPGANAGGASADVRSSSDVLSADPSGESLDAGAGSALGAGDLDSQPAPKPPQQT
jgi:serine O-acetyltransferase